VQIAQIATTIIRKVKKCSTIIIDVR